MTEPDAPTSSSDDAVPTCYRHPDVETRIRCTRCDRPICPQCMIPAAVGFQCPDDVRSGHQGVRVARTPFGGRAAAAGFPVTVTLIAINVAVYLVMVAQGHNQDVTGSSLFARFDDNPISIGVQHQYYRLLTAAFTHLTLLHIAFNMYALFAVGPALERIFGRSRFLALYLIAGVGGNVAVFVNNSAGAGASTSIFGLFVAYFVVARRVGVDTTNIVVTIALNIALTFTLSGISKAGHIGGLITGGVVAAVLVYAPRGPRQSQLQVAGMAAVVAVLAVLTFTHHVALPPGFVQCGSHICLAP
ncbi:MAG TPA: rhomboid family intramembrane serine protease [Mycobacteriales bacterium]|nr:rhomboid family intramembrane serine protease [Mycobacteriales bacterium]